MQREGGENHIPQHYCEGGKGGQLLGGKDHPYQKKEGKKANPSPYPQRETRFGKGGKPFSSTEGGKKRESSFNEGKGVIKKRRGGSSSHRERGKGGKRECCFPFF